MKRTRRNEMQVMTHSLAENRKKMNMYRDFYNSWRAELGKANRGENLYHEKRCIMASLNHCRHQLRHYMGAVEIQLGRI